MVAQYRPLLEQPDGMNQVQLHLADRGVNVIDAIWVAKTLIGGPGALGQQQEAKQLSQGLLQLLND